MLATGVPKLKTWLGTQRAKGEVRAFCRFWVFDGNGLLGHRLIDSHWFEKNSPTESGWKRRSKKASTYRYFARKCSWRNMCFQVRAISSRLWFTYIFAFDSGSFVDRWLLKEVWYAPDFLSNCGTRVSLAAPGITRSPSKRICRGTLSQKTRNWPTCKPVHVHERSCERRRSFDQAYSSTTWLSRSLASEARRLGAAQGRSWVGCRGDFYAGVRVSSPGKFFYSKEAEPPKI